MKMKEKIMPVITCFFLGLLALTVGITSLVKRIHYLPVEATILRIEEEYDMTEERYNYKTFARYQVDGKEYEGDIGFYAAGFKEGKVIEIRYDANNPENVVAATPGVLIYFIGIGTVLTGVGVSMLISKKEYDFDS